jgi:hypothetical protein
MSELQQQQRNMIGAQARRPGAMPATRCRYDLSDPYRKPYRNGRFAMADFGGVAKGALPIRNTVDCGIELCESCGTETAPTKA